ncbi:glutamic acid-rich protein-like isoform X3 [Nothobranchius furzeri]|uniref:glutamic acid-rich protein-like isoform X3 n=1 Tax=Nothobranchius furzeri TaxID=105023 RepID=UPI00390480C7
MDSGESLMDFVNKQVATARKLITKVEEALAQFEEGLGDQRRLSDVSWEPQSRSHGAELPQNHVWENKMALTDQRLSKQKWTSSLDQKEPEPPLMKEEQQELLIHQHEGQFLLKQEVVTFMEPSPSEETDCHEPEPNKKQLLCQSTTEAENQDQCGCRKENSESNSNEELTRNKICQSKDHRDSVDDKKQKRHKRAHTELPQHHVWENKMALIDQQLSKQKWTSSLDQNEPEPPLMKEEQQELLIHQHEGQFLLKQEVVTFMEPFPSEETDCREPEPNKNQPLCQSTTEAENQDQGGCRKENSDSNSNEELTRNKICQSKDHRDSVDDKKQKRHMRTHTELPQHHVWENKMALTDQRLSKQKWTSSLDQKEPEPPLMKEEQQELLIHQHEGQFLLKQEVVTFMEPSPSEESYCHEPEPNKNQPLCQSTTEAENQDQGGCRKENSESNSNEELTRNKICQSRDHRDSVDDKKTKKAQEGSHR